MHVNSNAVESQVNESQSDQSTIEFSGVHKLVSLNFRLALFAGK